MKKWCKILPFFIVEWWAKKNCEIIVREDEMHVVRPFKNVEIAVPAHPEATEARHAKWREGAIKTSIDASGWGWDKSGKWAVDERDRIREMSNVDTDKIAKWRKAFKDASESYK